MTLATRAYATLEIKSVDDAAGTITGIASTPSTDRMGDIVEPKGAEFKLPIPLLWQHKSDQPIGTVLQAKVTNAGINIVAKIERGVLPEIDRAWALIKAGLVRGLSIGFKPLEYSQLDDGGVRFTRWSWLELSAVTIPANQDATIQTIKSLDAEAPSPSIGATTARGVVRLNPPGVPGSQSQHTAVKPKQGTSMKTIKEQIESFQNARAAKAARMEALMSKASDEGRTLDTAETEEYDTLAGEVKSVDDHLERLGRHEATLLAKAQAVTPASGAEAGDKPRQPYIVHGKSQLPVGTAFVRYTMCYVAARGNEEKAANLARRFRDSTPEVENVLRAQAGGMEIKTAVAAGNTTDANWASPLVQYANLSQEFVNYLRPQTIIGRLKLRQVPFMVRIPTQTAGVSANWVGQGSPKPVSKPQFSSLTMTFSKIAVIVAMTEELVNFSSPSAESVVRDDMVAAIAQFSDQQFLSPGVAAVSNVSPASITNGLTPIQSGGATVALVTADIKSVFAASISANITLDSAVWIMHPNTALALSTLRTSQDIYSFPDITINGGTFFGIPVIVSANVPYSVSGGSMIVLVNQNDVLLADDGQVTLDLSREASIELNDAPSGGATSLVSLWQNNLIGLKAERYINWQVRRTGAVSYIDNIHY
jgi:HK97 family phage major capsid protein/HK97 family phage prohead protease